MAQGRSQVMKFSVMKFLPLILLGHGIWEEVFFLFSFFLFFTLFNLFLFFLCQFLEGQGRGRLCACCFPLV